MSLKSSKETTSKYEKDQYLEKTVKTHIFLISKKNGKQLGKNI